MRLDRILNIASPQAVFDLLKKTHFKKNPIKKHEWLKEVTAKLQIGFLTNGSGYTTPIALKKVEERAGTKIKKVDYTLPSTLDGMALIEEIVNSLNLLMQKEWHKNYPSLAQAFLEKVSSKELAAPLCLQIILQIKKEAEKLDGIFLPGSHYNVPKFWYQGAEPYLSPENCYRSVIELCLLHEAHTRGIPLMAVCRGFQIAYVYHGAKLQPDVQNQFGTQLLTLTEKSPHGLLTHLFQQGVQGQAMHTQGVRLEDANREDSALQLLSAYDQLAKAAELKHGGSVPVILTQFHPEMYQPSPYLLNEEAQAKNNEKIMEIFDAAMKARRVKQETLTPLALREAKQKLRSVEPKCDSENEFQEKIKKVLQSINSLFCQEF